MSTITDPTQTLLTPEDVLALPDAVGYELDDGRLVDRNTSVESTYIALKLGRLIGNHADDRGLGLTFGSDLGLRIFPGRPAKFRRADLSYYQLHRFTPEMMTLGLMELAPDLVVEVVSPGDLYYEVDRKVAEYLQAGVLLVWVINPSIQTVHLYRFDGSYTRLHNDDFLDGEEVLPGFRCKIDELFVFPTSTSPASS